MNRSCKMSDLPVIPTPPAQYWREFRVRFLPFVIFAGALGTVVFLWRGNVAAPTVLGQVEAKLANISSHKAGILANLNLKPLQQIKAGELVAQVITTEPKILQSSLAIIEAEIRVLRLNLEPILGTQRLAVDTDRLRLD